MVMLQGRNEKCSNVSSHINNFIAEMFLAMPLSSKFSVNSWLHVLFETHVPNAFFEKK